MKTGAPFCRHSYPIRLIWRFSNIRTEIMISSSQTHLCGNANSCCTTIEPGPGSLVPMMPATMAFKNAPWIQRTSGDASVLCIRFVSPVSWANWSTSCWVMIRFSTCRGISLMPQKVNLMGVFTLNRDLYRTFARKLLKSVIFAWLLLWKLWPNCEVFCSWNFGNFALSLDSMLWILMNVFRLNPTAVMWRWRSQRFFRMCDEATGKWQRFLPPQLWFDGIQGLRQKKFRISSTCNAFNWSENVVAEKPTNPNKDYTIQLGRAALSSNSDWKSVAKIDRSLWSLSDIRNSVDHTKNWPNLLSLAPAPLHKFGEKQQIKQTISNGGKRTRRRITTHQHLSSHNIRPPAD